MDVFAIGTGRKRRPKTSSIARSALPPTRGGGFAKVKAVTLYTFRHTRPRRATFYGPAAIQ